MNPGIPDLLPKAEKARSEDTVFTGVAKNLGEHGGEFPQRENQVTKLPWR
jgi:hypothetical protein